MSSYEFWSMFIAVVAIVSSAGNWLYSYFSKKGSIKFQYKISSIHEPTPSVRITVYTLNFSDNLFTVKKIKVFSSSGNSLKTKEFKSYIVHPRDYHRFSFAVHGTLEELRSISKIKICTTRRKLAFNGKKLKE